MTLQKSKKPFNNYAKYSNLAFQILGLLLLGVFGGYKLDKLLTLHFPVFTLVGSVIAFALVIYIILKDFSKK